jgi:hypothetical protein
MDAVSLILEPLLLRRTRAHLSTKTHSERFSVSHVITLDELDDSNRNFQDELVDEIVGIVFLCLSVPKIKSFLLPLYTAVKSQNVASAKHNCSVGIHCLLC